MFNIASNSSTKQMDLLLSLVFALPLATANFGPFSRDFQKFLQNNGEHWASSLSKEYGESGCFGGKQTEYDHLHHDPIIFIHGNADSALKHEPSGNYTGWDPVLAELLGKHFYKLGELYGITYGTRNLSTSFNTRISCTLLIDIKNFVQLVLRYTKREKFDIVGHSMGATIARMVVQGGKIRTFDNEECDLGHSLRDTVDTIVLLSAANRGMCMCLGFEQFGACSTDFGFYPGKCLDSDVAMDKSACVTQRCATATNRSTFLTKIDEVSSAVSDAPFMYSVTSKHNAGNTWGRSTADAPGYTTIMLPGLYDHFTTKSNAGFVIYKAANKHTDPKSMLQEMSAHYDPTGLYHRFTKRTTSSENID